MWKSGAVVKYASTLPSSLTPTTWSDTDELASLTRMSEFWIVIVDPVYGLTTSPLKAGLPPSAYSAATWLPSAEIIALSTNEPAAVFDGNRLILLPVVAL